MPPGHRPLVLAAALVLSACSDPAQQRGQSDAAVPRWHGTAELTMGSLEGTHDQFGSPSGIAVDRQGRIFISDDENHVVAVFDSTGRYRFSIGREGSGPGELKGPCCLAIDARGDLWVRDAFNARYNRYAIGDTAATLRETRKMTSGVTGLWSRLTFDPLGNLVDVITRPFPDSKTRVLRFHADSSGAVGQVDTITGPPGDSLGVHAFAVGNDAFGFINQPYGPRFLVDHAPGGGYARAVSSRYLVHWTGAGDSTRTIRRDMIGPALSVRERQEADSALQAQAREMGQPASTLPFGVPGSKTPIKAIMFDQQGRLWVELNVGDRENSRADVWDATGRRIANVEWPADVDLKHGWIDDRVAYGIREDSAGVPQVVRIRFK